MVRAHNEMLLRLKEEGNTPHLQQHSGPGGTVLCEMSWTQKHKHCGSCLPVESKIVKLTETEKNGGGQALGEGMGMERGWPKGRTF